MKSKKERNYIIFYCILCIISVIMIENTLGKIGIHMFVKQVSTEGIDYDAFREMKLSDKVIQTVKNELTLLPKKNQSNKDNNQLSWDTTDSLTLSMMINQYDLKKIKSFNKSNSNYLLNAFAYNQNFQELKAYYVAVIKDIECFPVPDKSNGESCVTYTNSWNSYRSYGGNRRHEGTDLMAVENIRGLYPIVSMTNGTIEKLGWLEQGGYRIGIRGDSGAYYYYAHLDSYATDLKIGDVLHVGQFLGYMGDSGYGVEGTKGMFDVHLHVGIYVEGPNGELSINPYWLLRYLEKK